MQGNEQRGLMDIVLEKLPKITKNLWCVPRRERERVALRSLTVLTENKQQ